MGKSVGRNNLMIFIGLLTVLFIILKIVGLTEWNWIWVLSGIWLGFGLGIIIHIIDKFFNK